MDGHGTGGHDLPKRVSSLEVTVGQLHEDQVETKRMISEQALSLSALQVASDANGQLLRDVAGKLDETRTKKPPWGVFAAWATVLIVIGGLAFAPINNRVASLEAAASGVSSILIDKAELMGAVSSEMDRVFDELEEVRNAQREMQKNRFTKSDGQRLEDKVDRLHQ